LLTISPWLLFQAALVVELLLLSQVALVVEKEVEVGVVVVMAYHPAIPEREVSSL